MRVVIYETPEPFSHSRTQSLVGDSKRSSAILALVMRLMDYFVCYIP